MFVCMIGLVSALDETNLHDAWKLDDDTYANTHFSNYVSGRPSLYNDGGTSGITGVDGEAWDSDAQADKAYNTSTLIDYSAQSESTISLWVNTSAWTQKDDTIFSITTDALDNNNNMLALNTMTGGEFQFLLKVDGTTRINEGSIAHDQQTNTWVNIVIRNNATTVSIWSNGEQVGSVSNAGYWFNNFTGTWGSVDLMGQGYYAGWIGSTDEVYIFNTSLTNAQILELNSTFLPFVEPTPPTNSSWNVTSANVQGNSSLWNTGDTVNITSNLLSWTVTTDVNSNMSCSNKNYNYTTMVAYNISSKSSTTATQSHADTAYFDIPLNASCMYCAFITSNTGLEETNSSSGCLSVQFNNVYNPIWTANSTNITSSIRTDDSVKFGVNWSDGTGLDYTTFSWNGTSCGAMVNDTPLWEESTTIVTKNVTKNMSCTVGDTVCWRWYANDTSGNINMTDLWCIEITNTIPVVGNVSIVNSDSNNYTNGSLTGYFNYSDPDSDPQTDNQTKWFKNGVLYDTYCYQESANTTDQSGTDGSCTTLLYTGKYSQPGSWGNPNNLVDGNFNTAADFPIGSGTKYFYVNYSIPDFAINAKWRIKYWDATAGGTFYNYNLSIPFGVITTTLELRTTCALSSGQCQPMQWWYYNTTDWVSLFSDTTSSSRRFYEEGVDWNVTRFIPSSATSAGDNWTFSARAYDGYNWSSWVNSSQMTIADYPTATVTSVLNSNLSSTISWNYAPNSSAIYDLINFSNPTVMAGNYSWTYSEYNSTTLNSTSWDFNVTNAGSWGYLKLSVNQSYNWIDWKCNGTSIGTTNTSLGYIEAGESILLNCTMDFVNISQTYVNWTLTENNASWNFNYSFS